MFRKDKDDAIHIYEYDIMKNCFIREKLVYSFLEC